MTVVHCTTVLGIARLVAEALSRAEALTALQVDASSLEACLFVLAHMGAAVPALASIAATAMCRHLLL